MIAGANRGCNERDWAFMFRPTRTRNSKWGLEAFVMLFYAAMIVITLSFLRLCRCSLHEELYHPLFPLEKGVSPAA